MQLEIEISLSVHFNPVIDYRPSTLDRPRLHDEQGRASKLCPEQPRMRRAESHAAHIHRAQRRARLAHPSRRLPTCERNRD
jgi:hypothetical protein